MPEEPIRSCRDLLVWRKAMQLAVRISRLTEDFPAKEQWRLSRQMGRSSLSVPSHVAEGYGRGSTGDDVRFLSIARGSLMELETQVIFAEMREYLSKSVAEGLLADLSEISKMLTSMINKLKG